MLKNRNFLLTVILPIFISIAVGTVIIILNSTSLLKTRAAATIAGEMKQFTSEMSALKSEKKTLKKEAAKYDNELEANNIMLEEINSLTAELTDYTTAVEHAKETIESLDLTINDKTAYNESLASVSPDVAGGTKSYSNDKLNIPSDLKAGRYKAEGTGTIMIYTIAGTLQDKQNLSVIDTHSYTFDILSGQSLKIEGTVSLTEIN